jgi:hypothetical protein
LNFDNIDYQWSENEEANEVSGQVAMAVTESTSEQPLKRKSISGFLDQRLKL